MAKSPSVPPSEPQADRAPVSLWLLMRELFFLGSISFGGGMFSLLHERFVEEKKWLTEDDFRECITCSELAPGPFTLHVVMYIGYHLRRWAGLIGATVAFSMPSILIVISIAFFNRYFMREIPGLSAFISGIWAAIFALMATTILNLGKKVFRDRSLFFIALLALAAIVFLDANFFVVILSGGALLVAMHAIRIPLLTPRREPGSDGEVPSA